MGQKLSVDGPRSLRSRVDDLSRVLPLLLPDARCELTVPRDAAGLPRGAEGLLHRMRSRVRIHLPDGEHSPPAALASREARRSVSQLPISRAARPTAAATSLAGRASARRAMCLDA